MPLLDNPQHERFIPAVARTGRPTLKTPEVCSEVCDRIAEAKSLRVIEREPGMPSKTTILRWLGDDSKFRGSYALARGLAADALVDEMLSIADNVDEDPQSRRVRIDTRKWLASKLAPKKYGDKVELEHSGGHNITITIGGDDFHG